MSPSPPPPSRTVAGRLLGSFLLVILAFAATVGWSVSALRAAARDASLVREAYLPLQRAISDALAGQNVMNAQLNHVTSAKNPSDVKQWIETAQRLRPLVFRRLGEEALQGLDPELDRDGLRQYVKEEAVALAGLLEESRPPTAEMFEAIESGEADHANRLRDSIVERETEVAKRLRAMRQRIDAQTEAVISSAGRREAQSFTLLLALLAFSLAVGVAMAAYARRVLHPLSEVTERARAVAAGDLSAHSHVTTKDEIGELAATFEDMVAAIRKARGELVKAERLATIGKMAAHITHEVRNPLSSIGLNLELLEEEFRDHPDRNEAEQLVAAIQREVERLSLIAEQYLSVAREPKPLLREEELGDIVDEVVSFVGPELKRAEVEYVVEVEAGLPALLLDEAQVRQVLLNLIRNAREVLGGGGGRIRLQLRRLDAGRVSLIMEDNGPGVAEDVRSNIFDPFITTKRHGTGLGLAVTKAIVDAHGGEIRCEEAVSGGARFVILLPIPDPDPSFHKVKGGGHREETDEHEADRAEHQR